ncbi:hypothetical protein J6590_047255 [Homalodisca vitripennis]|nr:hypothetical protein J6590_047255 [Homalodisca vitripennis]
MAERSKSPWDFWAELEIAKVHILSVIVALFISTIDLVLYRLSPLSCLIRSSHWPVAPVPELLACKLYFYSRRVQSAVNFLVFVIFLTTLLNAATSDNEFWARRQKGKANRNNQRQVQQFRNLPVSGTSAS